MISCIFDAVIYSLGAITVLSWIYNNFCFWYRTNYGTPATTQRYGQNSWALVLGAIDLIGYAAANELASRGFNIVLVGDDKVKLE